MNHPEGMATKKITGKNHKNHKRSESSRKNQLVGEKIQIKINGGNPKEIFPWSSFTVSFLYEINLGALANKRGRTKERSCPWSLFAWVLMGIFKIV
jgi:hypothetical protein